MENDEKTICPVTLEEIVRRKEIVRGQLAAQRAEIADTVREMVAPTPPVGGASHPLVQGFRTGMMIFDGVMTGLKIMRKIRTFILKMR